MFINSEIVKTQDHPALRFLKEYIPLNKMGEIVCPLTDRHFLKKNTTFDDLNPRIFKKNLEKTILSISEDRYSWSKIKAIFLPDVMRKLAQSIQ